MASSRLVHNALLNSLATSRYAILSIDHPYDANIAEFPNKLHIYGILADKLYYVENGTLIPNYELFAFSVQLRANDITFALNKISELDTVSRLLSREKSAFVATKTTISGHSLGGAASTLSLTTEPRLLGRLNLNGAPYGRSNIVAPTYLHTISPHYDTMVGR